MTQDNNELRVLFYTKEKTSQTHLSFGNTRTLHQEVPQQTSAHLELDGKDISLIGKNSRVRWWLRHEQYRNTLLAFGTPIPNTK